MSLLSEFTVGGLKLRTRTARSATWENLASDSGAATPALVSLMSEISRSSVGLIISSHIFVRPEGQAGPGQLSLCTDEVSESHREMVAAVHANGGVICAQLAHAGSAAIVKETRVGPSADESGTKEATLKDLDDFVASFAAAAVRAKRVGYDAVQVHSAHGYMLSQFLDGAMNKRTDDYGGSIENRARLLLRIVRAIREAVGPQFPIFVKLNVSDFQDGGMTIEESTKVVGWLADASVSMVEASGGVLQGKTTPIRRGKLSTEGYHKEGAASWKKALAGRNVVVCLVGGIRLPQTAQGFIDEGACDMISMSRPFIREPDVITKWQQQGVQSACVSCCGCFVHIMKGKYCCPVAAVKAAHSV
eukprot:m51a1_g3591 putative nadh:flavin oxidoreductase (361) ;mRNA; r:1163725-1165008